MTKRAKRLEKFLRETLGWSTQEEVWFCAVCNRSTFEEVNYCSECGCKVGKLHDREVIENLESALVYALTEPKKKKRG